MIYVIPFHLTVIDAIVVALIQGCWLATHWTELEGPNENCY